MVFDDRYTRLFNSDILDGAKRDGEFGVSTIHVTHARPSRLISFDKAIQCRDHDQWIHHYIPDPLFSRILGNPWRYLPVYQRFAGAISPDFSIPIHLPLHVQLHSVAVGRAMGSWLQRCGVDVIPNVRWGRKDTYRFCFDGIEPGGTVAIGTVGCVRDAELREVFRQGVSEMIRRVAPPCVVVYGPLREDLLAPVLETGAEVLHFKSQTALAHEAV